MTWLALLPLLAAVQPPDNVPLPPGHRPLGPPLRSEVIPGWETFLGDVQMDRRDCAEIEQWRIQPLNPPQRQIGVTRLANVPFLRVSEPEAARLIGATYRRGRPLAVTILEGQVAEMRARKRRAMVEHRDSWSVADQQELDRIIAHLGTPALRRLRPWLVRAVAKFGDGHGGAPSMFGSFCGGAELHLNTLTFSYTIPPSERVPAIVFLERPPARVVASVMVAM